VGMKISELCKMIEESIRTGKYPLDQEIEKQMASLIKVTNKSSSDDLREKDIKIEVRIKDLYVLNNYVQGLQHLPGVIEIDALDSFKMLCRRVGRVEKSNVSLDK
jgi:adenylyl- and sulfurtransferase ThiI